MKKLLVEFGSVVGKDNIVDRVVVIECNDEKDFVEKCLLEWFGSVEKCVEFWDDYYYCKSMKNVVKKVIDDYIVRFRKYFSEEDKYFKIISEYKEFNFRLKGVKYRVINY